MINQHLTPLPRDNYTVTCNTDLGHVGCQVVSTTVACAEKYRSNNLSICLRILELFWSSECLTISVGTKNNFWRLTIDFRILEY